MNADTARLGAAIEVTRRAAARMRLSLGADRALLEATFSAPEDELGQAQLNALDAFVQRFQQLVEHMTRRFYPAIYRSEEYGERPPPARTLMNLYEGAGLFPSARQWADRIELRNQLVHEYPLDPRDRSLALGAALTEAGLMLDDLERAMTYIADHALLEANDE